MNALHLSADEIPDNLETSENQESSPEIKMDDKINSSLSDMHEKIDSLLSENQTQGQSTVDVTEYTHELLEKIQISQLNSFESAKVTNSLLVCILFGVCIIAGCLFAGIVWRKL